MLCRVYIVHIQPRKHVLEHADHTAHTRQHEPDHTDHADHTDQTGEGSICRQGPRSSSGNRLSVKGVKTCLLYTSDAADE